jgi:Domain of unknown function (DUF4037)
VRTFSQVGTPFVPGSEPGRRFHAEVVGPLLDAEFPGLPYAAMSTDDPAVTLFLPDGEVTRAPAIRSVLAARLPDPDRPVLTTTVRAYARRQLGWDPADPLSVADWLSFPAPQLLAVTTGPVLVDGVGDLTRLRGRLAWYPTDLWRYLLAAGWTRLDAEEQLMARAGRAGDELGSAVIGGRLARDLMRLGFLLERRYAPDPAWFGTAFAELAGAPALTPLLAELVGAASWPERQDAYATAAGLVVARQNELELAAPLDPRPRLSGGGPFWVIDGGRVAAALVAAVTDPAVRRLTRRRLIGSVDQWSDSAELTDVQYRADVRRFYS